jgi:hypothetical protein
MPVKTHKTKWIPLPQSEATPYHSKTLVTRLHYDPKIPNVCIGYPGWNYSNNEVIAYAEITPLNNTWNCIYRGDDEPTKDGWYLVTLAKSQPTYTNVTQLYYEHRICKWYAVPPGWDVYAWLPIPSPYGGDTQHV